jgi:hypothetical protein
VCFVGERRNVVDIVSTEIDGDAVPGVSERSKVISSVKVFLVLVSEIASETVMVFVRVDVNSSVRVAVSSSVRLPEFDRV